jgi:hypothetical protein
MKDIPWWVWAALAAGGLYLYSKSSSASGSQVYIPANTTLFSDAAMTQNAGSTSAGGISTVTQVSGGASQITVGASAGSAGTQYWVATSALQSATATQLSASAAGTLS